MSKHIDSGTLNPNDLCSGAVTATSGGLDVLATGPVGAAQVSFSCSRRQGAILSLPVQAQRQDTVARGEFGRWIVKHINLWFAFTQELGLGLNRMEDIILVTGFHRARSWANIAFSEGSGGARVSFGVRVSGTSGTNVEWKYSREDIQGVVLNLGPSGQNLPEDQCIFVRGFRVTRFIRILPRLRGAAGPAPLPDGHEPEPDAQLYQDPLRTLLEYIAEVGTPWEIFCATVSLEGNQPDEIRGYLQNLAPKLQELRFDTFPVHKSSEGAQMATATVAMLSSHASDLPADNPSLESHNTLRSDGQHSVGLASSPQPTESSPQPLAKLSPELCALFNASLDEYTQQTGILLASHPLTANLENSNSPEAFIAVIDQTRAFHDFRRGDWRMLLMRLLKPLMNVLLALSTTAALGDDLRLVLSPSKAIFGAIGIFLSVCISFMISIFGNVIWIFLGTQGVSARSNAFVELFETLGSFLDLLRVYTVIQLLRR
ncbi:hypothetical protein B0F90DRAFT_1671913 [Multifurca ochricompacta]|uniref:Uncharacterized protein n=1 Tax=Multifurca ochricompacta TaxID=376703 RepID=A0AAD4QIX9_9AGAM|nr:hypothetical protein B0F90DRAFT_1671913 [Multifurca ochricompacta]